MTTLENNNYQSYLIKAAIWPTIARAAARVGPKVLPALERAGGSIARFGKRQLHGLTGYVPGLERGASKARRLKALEEIGIKAEQGKPGLIDRLTKAIKGEKKWLASRAARAQAQREMIEKGYTSLPGVAKGLVSGKLEPIRLGWKAMSPGEKAFMAGFGGLGAYDVATAENKGEALGRTVASMALWPALGSVAFVPQMAAWMGGEEAGGRIGRGIKKLVMPSPTPRTKPLAKMPASIKFEKIR